MSLLHELLASDSGHAPLAKLANLANLHPRTAKDSQDSQLSQGQRAGSVVYALLLKLAGTYGYPPALLERIRTAELPEYANASSEYLLALLDALQDDAEQHAGRGTARLDYPGAVRALRAGVAAPERGAPVERQGWMAVCSAGLPVVLRPQGRQVPATAAGGKRNLRALATRQREPVRRIRAMPMRAALPA